MMFALDIETSGLKPEDCFITCIGIADERGLKQWSAPAAHFRQDWWAAEQELIEEFCRDVEDCAVATEETLVTYNGVQFDLPFMETRFKSNQQDLPNLLMQAHHIDLFFFVKSLYGRAAGKDDAIRRFSNIYVPKNSSGSYLARMYTNGKATDQDHMEMLQHNAIDCCATLRFALSLRGYKDFEDFMRGED